MVYVKNPLHPADKAEPKLAWKHRADVIRNQKQTQEKEQMPFKFFFKYQDFIAQLYATNKWLSGHDKHYL